MKTLSVVVSTLLLFALLAAPTYAWQTEKDVSSAPRMVQKFEVDFSGGTVDEFLETVRQAYLHSLSADNASERQLQSEIANWNIVLTENGKHFRLPQIKVTTNLKGILNLLDAIGGNDYSVSVEHVGDDEEILLIDVSSIEELEMMVVNTKQLLESVPEATLMSAITSGLEMAGSASQVELKLHEETGLLFAKGIGREVRLVDDIVSQLSSGQGRGMGGMMGSMGGMSMEMGGMDEGYGGGYEGGEEDMMGGGMGMSGMAAPGGGMGMGASGGRMGGGMGMGGGRRFPAQVKKKPSQK